MKTAFLLMVGKLYDHWNNFSYLIFLIPLSHSIMFSTFLLRKLLLSIYRISCHCWSIKIVLRDNEQWRHGNKITTPVVRNSFKLHFNPHSIVIHIVFYKLWQIASKTIWSRTVRLPWKSIFRIRLFYPGSQLSQATKRTL